ncbi:MAG: GIY-YIG nuclease family protein [Bacteroidales bacterium]|nr:GIY-YIG nuclease family protein [Bacteroidales bacterium]
MDNENNQYIYIVQSSSAEEKPFCKIGKTNDLDRRLKEYNNITGKPTNIVYRYLFACEVSDMSSVENAIKEEFSYIREVKNKEIYFFNPELLDKYINFIKSHKLFVKEIFTKIDDKKQEIKIIKKTTPSLEERGLTRKDLLQNAKKTKNDEFYTRYEDVEKEMTMYAQEIWEDSVVFCNCDDAVDTDERKTSAFALYFIKNFKEIGLKKLICTHYSGGLDLFNQGAKGYIFTYIFTKTGFKEEKEYPKGYTGSFDEPLSLKILNEEADIICTNPPFSKMAEYWKIVVESGKKFIILSAMTNPINTAFIHYFMENKVWTGYNRVDNFLNPKKEPVVNEAFWYTNIPINDRPRYKQLKIMPLKDIPEKHKKYDDSKILVVDNCYIPNDYKKPFAISVFPIFNGILEKGYKIIQKKQYEPYINGKRKFGRVLVQKI